MLTSSTLRPSFFLGVTIAAFWLVGRLPTRKDTLHSRNVGGVKLKNSSRTTVVWGPAGHAVFSGDSTGTSIVYSLKSVNSLPQDDEYVGVRFGFEEK